MILGPHVDIERLANGHHRRRETVYAGGFAANHDDGLYGQADRFAAAVEVDIERHGHSVARETWQQQAAAAAAGVAVGHRDSVALRQPPGNEAKHQRVGSGSKTAVHAAHRRGGFGEPHRWIRRRDADVVVAGLVIGLERHAGHEVAGDDDAATGGDVFGTQGIDLPNRGVGANGERPRIRYQRADGVGLFVQQRHFSNHGIQAGDSPGIGGIRQYARRRLGGVHRHVAACQRVGVDPVPNSARSGFGVGAAARRSRHLRFQRFNLGAQRFVQIVRLAIGGQCQQTGSDDGDVARAHQSASRSTRFSNIVMRCASISSVSRQKSGLVRSTCKCLAASSSAVMRPVSRKSAK